MLQTFNQPDAPEVGPAITGKAALKLAVKLAGDEPLAGGGRCDAGALSRCGVKLYEARCPAWQVPGCIIAGA